MKCLTYCLSFALMACAAESTEPSSSPTPDVVDAADDVAAGPEDTASPNPDVADDDVAEPEPLLATDYCEEAAAVFCPYYVRCGRMAVADEAECLTVFPPACNARFEDEYAHLAAAGLLTLSAEGLAACAAHLDTVSCDQQIFDLDLGCQDVWQGQAPAGGACGPGIESFVCADGTTCVLGLDFCGTCEPAGDIGEPCADGRCVPAAVCLEGTCQPRPLPGEPCADGPPCVLGSSCEDGVCVARPWVGSGEACGQNIRCQYKTACIGGVCEPMALQGETCGGVTACASGHCTAAGTCQANLEDGAPCTADGQCLSARCDGGICAERQTRCIPGV